MEQFERIRRPSSAPRSNTHSVTYAIKVYPEVQAAIAALPPRG